MEITMNHIGRLLEGLNNSNYFNSDSLAEAIIILKEDNQTSFGMSFQLENLDPKEQVLFNELLEKGKI